MNFEQIKEITDSLNQQTEQLKRIANLLESIIDLKASNYPDYIRTKYIRSSNNDY